jgi:hypothetical protein
LLRQTSVWRWDVIESVKPAPDWCKHPAGAHPACG